MKLELCAPYTRELRRQPLLILSKPARQALVIEFDGTVRARSLMGVAAGLHPPPTSAQCAALRLLADLCPAWGEYLCDTLPWTEEDLTSEEDVRRSTHSAERGRELRELADRLLR